MQLSKSIAVASRSNVIYFQQILLLLKLIQPQSLVSANLLKLNLF
jgi:hypothetical protein